LKLIFDISVLAWSVRNPKAKTGIFRVIENHLKHLAKDPEIDLYLSSVNGHITDFFEYIKTSNIELSKDRFLVPKKYSKAKDRFFVLYNWLSDKFEFSYSWNHLSFLVKLLQSIVRFVFQKIGIKSYLNPIPGSYLTNEFIFHSPYLPLPKFICESNVKKVISIYDIISIKFPEFFQGNKDRVIIQNIRYLDNETSIITISENSKIDIAKEASLFDPDRIFVVPLAAETFFFKTDEKNTEKAIQKYGLVYGKYILSVGTLEPRKNLKMSIRAFLEISRKGMDPELKYAVLGGKGWGDGFDDLKTEFSDCFKERVRFLGFVRDEDLSFVYSGALFFVYLSFYEGFGLPPLEAMQCGLPVLVSNTSSLPEVVGDAGILVDPRDQKRIQTEMQNLIANKKLRESLSRKSMQRANSFSWEESTLALKSVYKNILN